HIDLHQDAADVIGSVASFLYDAGWQPGLPTHFDVAAPVETRDRAWLLAPDILPSFTAQEFAARGAVLDDAAKAYDGKLALVELRGGDEQLLRGDPLQLVELLRDGGHRAGGCGEASTRALTPAAFSRPVARLSREQYSGSAAPARPALPHPFQQNQGSGATRKA